MFRPCSPIFALAVLAALPAGAASTQAQSSADQARHRCCPDRAVEISEPFKISSVKLFPSDPLALLNAVTRSLARRASWLSANSCPTGCTEEIEKSPVEIHLTKRPDLFVDSGRCSERSTSAEVTVSGTGVGCEMAMSLALMEAEPFLTTRPAGTCGEGCKPGRLVFDQFNVEQRDFLGICSVSGTARVLILCYDEEAVPHDSRVWFGTIDQSITRSCFED